MYSGDQGLDTAEVVCAILGLNEFTNYTKTQEDCFRGMACDGIWDVLDDQTRTQKKPHTKTIRRRTVL